MKKILLAAITILLAHVAEAQWTSMGSGPGGTVRALCVHNDTLFAGGDFTGRVKKWDPSTNTWYTVGSLTGNSVRALISYNGSLYAGGQLSGVGNVARLSGSTWTQVASGLTGGAGTVNCFYNWNGVLCAGGAFTLSGVSSVHNAAILAGEAWQQLGPDVPTHLTAAVYAMTAYNGNLYLGGEGSAPFMDKLVGNTWDATWYTSGGGPNLGVYALDVFNHGSQGSTLFIGGIFQSPGNRIGTYTAANGFGLAQNNFDASSVGVYSLIHSPNTTTGYVFAGGTFSVLGSSNVTKKMATGNWAAATSGTAPGADVRALCFYKGYLVAGGSFSTPFANVVRTATNVGIDELDENILSNACFPNPMVKEATLKIQTKGEMKNPSLLFLDVTGKEIAGNTMLSAFDRAQNQVEFTISREGLAAGIYYYMLLDEQRAVATGKLVVE